MASTTFTDLQTPIVAAWLNDVNAWTYSGTFAGTQIPLDKIVLDKANQDVILVRDAAGILAQRNGATAQVFRIYNTFTDASNYKRAIIHSNLFGDNIPAFAVEGAGTGANPGMYIGTTGTGILKFFTNNATKWAIQSGGDFTANTDNSYDIGQSGAARPRTVYAGTSVVIAGQSYTANGAIAAIGYVIDGAGSVPTTGVKGDLLIPFACTINSATLQADQSGSAVIDVWKKTYTLDSPPTVANTITASALPTLASHQSAQDTTLTGWTTSIAANDMLRFNLNSVTTCTRLTLTLKVTKT